MILEVNTTWTITSSNSAGSTATGTGTGFDTSTLQLVAFNETRLMALLDPMPPNVQTPVGGLIYSTCTGTTLTEYLFGGGNLVSSVVTPNSPTCGYASPLSCKLLALTVSQVVTPTGANVTAAFTGTVNGTAQYQLDGGPLQSSPGFTGLLPGVHVIEVLDDGLAGCSEQVIFTVLPPNVPPLPPIGPPLFIEFVGQPVWHGIRYPTMGGALVEIEVWAESAHGAADFAPVLTLRKRADAQGEAMFRLDTLLLPLLRPFVPESYLTGVTQVCTSNILDYYVRTTVTPADPAQLVVYQISDLHTAVRGALPAEWQDTDYFDFRLSPEFALPPFLSWQPTGPGAYARGAAKNIVVGQPEWLFFVCPPALSGQQLQVSRSYRMSATARPVVDIEPLGPPPGGDWTNQLLAIPLHDARPGFATLVVQLETAAGDAVSLPAHYTFVERSARTRFLLFTNSLGGVDTLRTSDRARLDVTLEATTEKVERPLRRSWDEVNPVADRRVSDLTASRKLRLATGWLLLTELDWLQELVLTREVWHQVGPQLRELDWSKRSLAAYSDEPGLRGLLIEADYAFAPTAYAPTSYA
jgi:hypothetical protein